ncbi:hypothetical protein CROQUDRAFT_101621 [Cronartium quercuum f. sp. fusiforme G11]|uniref:Uncharacterized protein n=1 Tax=Cronartium quercuum f. sp. fusiforme G11 TaxID=708437 RepID=A0A9P6N8H2_9BASI|nr:hypothetical protein CROQUDRAFT_101621 [Cronartium quercuum f. sp. fusiforme G11]
MIHIEVHLPNGEDEDDDEATVQKISKKTRKASKEANGNYMTHKNDHPWEDISEGLKKALFHGEL